MNEISILNLVSDQPNNVSSAQEPIPRDQEQIKSTISKSVYK